MWLGKQVSIKEADKVGKAVVVTMVWCGSQQQEVIGGVGESFGQLVAFCFFYLVTAFRCALSVGTTLVRLVNDDDVPALLPDPLPHVVLLGIVDGTNHLGVTLPGIHQLLLVDRRKNEVERFPEPAEHFVLPLDRQRCRTENQNALDGLA
jgi:hypothetical protein